MEILDEEISETQEASVENDPCIIESVKSEVLKSIILALRLEAAGLSDLPDLNSQKEIDFYQEVQRFETKLIKQALIRVKGNQRAAAKLLGLKATTLNSKIKLYGIDNPYGKEFER